MKNQLAYLYLSLREFAKPLLERFSSLESLEYLFYKYGWRVSLDEVVFDKINQLSGIKTTIEQFLLVAEGLQNKLDEDSNADLSAQDIAALASSAKNLIQELADFKLSELIDLPEPLDKLDFWNSIRDHLLDDLLEEYLRIYHPNVYLTLHLWGVIRYEPTHPAAPFRRAYTKVVFDWGQLGSMVSNPLTALKQTYQ